jgi:hypothetical protein
VDTAAAPLGSDLKLIRADSAEMSVTTGSIVKGFDVVSDFLTFDESLHVAPASQRVAEVYEQAMRFYTALYGHRPVCQVDLHVMTQRGTGCSLISGLVVQAEACGP